MIEEIEMQDIELSFSDKLFSYKGLFGRLEYLIYSSIIPLSFIYLVFLLGQQLGFEKEFYSSDIGLVVFILSSVLALSISIFATIKRARSLETNIPLIVVLSLVPYLGFFIVMYLLFFPSKSKIKDITNKSTKIIESLFAVFAIFVIGYILFIVGVLSLISHQS